MRQKNVAWMGHGSWLREKMIRDGFIAGRNSLAESRAAQDDSVF